MNESTKTNRSSFNVYSPTKGKTSAYDTENPIFNSNKVNELTSLPELVQSSEFRVYPYRWVIILLFVFSTIVNSLLLLTWSPITDKADTYWEGIGITAINLLNVIFQIMYFPGTAVAIKLSQYANLRNFLIIGGFANTLGCAIRFIGGLFRHHLGAQASYILVLFGTLLVGLAQPFYLNLPAKVATTWFALNERDMATTVCFVAHSAGAALGSFISPRLVTGESYSAIKVGVENLLLIQFILSACAFVLVVLFYQSKPDLDPSKSAKNLSLNEQKNHSTKKFMSTLKQLFTNTEYIKLFVAFTILLGNMNSIAALLNQLPGQYSNAQIGGTGAVLVLSGIFGSLLAGFVIEYTKMYKLILKIAYPLAFCSWVLFLSNCRANNFNLFIFSAALLGFTTIPSSFFFILNSNYFSFVFFCIYM
jgi:FLVCR family MFS transporter 7